MACLGRTPVRKHEPTPTPLGTQDIVENVAVFRAVSAIDHVVGSHDARRIALLDRDFEWTGVVLVQGLVVHVGIGGHAVVVRVVQDIVLGACGAPAGLLHATHVGSAHLTEQHRIFAVGFLCTRPTRVSERVDHRCEGKLVLGCAHLPALEIAHSVFEIEIE